MDVTSATIHAGSICDSAHVALCRSVFVSLKGFYQICDNLELHLTANPHMDSTMAPTSVFAAHGIFRGLISYKLSTLIWSLDPPIQDNLGTATAHIGSAS